MRTIDLPATPSLRIMSFIGVCAMVAQLLILAEPSFAVKIVDATWDKAIHFLFFGTLAFLMWIVTGKRWPLVVFVVVLFIGAVDETQQAYTPGRTSDVDDWFADGFGAAAALMIAKRTTK